MLISITWMQMYAVCRFVIKRPAQLWINQVGRVIGDRLLHVLLGRDSTLRCGCGWGFDSLDVLQVNIGYYGGLDGARLLTCTHMPARSALVVFLCGIELASYDCCGIIP